jgi:hypothetical protein
MSGGVGVKVPTYDEAKAWAEERARALKNNPRDKEALCLLVLLKRLKELEPSQGLIIEGVTHDQDL